MTCSEYPFRYIALGIAQNRNTRHVQTRELARGRGHDVDQFVNSLLREHGGEIRQYDQLLLVTIGPAKEESGAPLNLHTEVICVTPPPAFVLKPLERRF